MNFVNRLYNSFVLNSKSNAFCIDDTFYTYEELLNYIVRIRKIINRNIESNERIIGLVTNNDIETYAAIFSLWTEGKAYIPINPFTPKARNIDILKSTDVVSVLDSSKTPIRLASFNIIKTLSSYSSHDDAPFDAVPYCGNNIAYVLFTSGSTGAPKGVPICFKNLDTLIAELDIDEAYKLKPSDRCLQMYELTFDASLTALLPSLLVGACSYTVPSNAIKYFYIIKLLHRYELTVMKMVPSIIYYLRPYFSEIKAPSVRYSIFGGEKLYEDVVQEWIKCVPNSKVLNHYGPTEFTVCSGYYAYKFNKKNRSHNGVLSIGKPFKNVDYIIVDEENRELKDNQEGELCLSGNQLTQGYWNNNKLNEQAFFLHKTASGITKKFYKTGDICFRDKDGYYLYVGRKDFQLKIGGYRVELGEIEYHIKSHSSAKFKNLVVMGVKSQNNTNELVLVIESSKFDIDDLFSFLKENLVDYMIPRRTVFIDSFPYTKNGKLDRKEIRKMIR